MKRRILALLLAICLILQTIPAFAGATEEQKVTAGTTSVTAGDTAYLSLQAENFVNIATLEVYVYYDPSVFSVNSTYNGYMLNESQASVNTAEAGTVKLVAMSLDGISGSGELLNLYFSTISGAAAGTYPIKVAIGNAYDTELKPVTVSGANGSITVREREETESFYVYNYTNNYYAQQGDTLYCYVNGEWSRGFVSGDFTFTYNHELFAYEDVTLSSELTTEGAIWSVNSSVLGQVRIAYACDKPINAYQLFTVKLKVIADKEEYTSLKIQAANVYRENLSMYLPYSSETWMQLQKLPEVTDDPNVWLETSGMIVGQPATSVFWVEKGAGIAAADFTVAYDPAVLRCAGVTVCDAVTEQNGMLMVNDNFNDGKVRFSYINMDAYDDEDLALVQIQWEPLRSPATHYQLTVSGVGVVDAAQKAIPLEYLSSSDCIFVRTVVPPTCLEDGYTNHVCACGKNYQTDPVIKLGHDIQDIPAQKVSCTEPGWDAHIGCTRCDYGTYVELPALGHDEIAHEGREVTCTEIGWEPYVTCSRCDHTTYVEIPPLGHRVSVLQSAMVDPLEIKNDGSLPFEVIDGVYYSQNHTDSSSTQFTITALHNCSVTFQYGVSSENNCDILSILRNSSQQVAISGSTTGSRTLSLNAGDVVTIRYRKDGSVSRDDDRGWVKLVYENVLAETYVDIPAETLEPDCVNAVVCTYCQTQIKAALGHDEIPHDGKAPTCLEPGWAEYITCSRCDYTSYQDLNALGHDEITHEAQLQTCLGIGWETYVTCSRCDYTTYQELSPLGHRVYMDRLGLVDPLEIQNEEAVPFEVIDGVYYSQNHADNSSSQFTVTALYDCTVTLIYSVSSETNYDKLYILRNGSQLDVISGTINNKRKTVAFAAGDVLTVRYTKDGSAQNGNDQGWIRFEYDNVSQMVPTLVPAEEKDPTCTEAVICAACGTEVEAALGHAQTYYEGKTPTCTEIGWNAYNTCSRCGETTYVELPATGHSSSGWIIDQEATYEADGSKHKECTVCNQVLETSIIPMLTHTYVAAVTLPTCTEQGYTTYTCSDCGSQYVEDYVTALGHLEIAHAAQAPTCTGIGWNAYVTCGRCDYTTYQNIPALGHSYGQWVQTKAPTCLAKGTERRDCAACDYFETRDVAALGHSIVYHAGQSATCTEIGWNAYECCSRGDYTTYEELPALGHTPSDWIIDREATYEAEGSKHKECTVCDQTLETSIIPVLTHTYAATVTPPTCTEQGYTTYTCSDCGNQYVEDYVSATGHSYSAWTQTLAPTCENMGTERRDCGVCGYYETKELSPTGHTESDWIIDSDATCTKDGAKHIGCTVCDKILETDVISKLGHWEIAHAAQTPTCEEIGWNAYVTCYRCDYTTYEEIARLGHDYYFNEPQAPTCTQSGWEISGGCNRCDYIIHVGLLALGHDLVEHNGQKPTCTEIGWKAYESCTRCDHTTYEELPALGHDPITHSAQEASCLGIGWNEYDTCSRCNYTNYQEIPALGHDMVHYDGKQPTCTEAGWAAYETCERCNYSTYEKLSATGHSYIDGVCTACGEKAPYIPGDVDGVSGITVEDAIYLLQHVLMPDLFPVTQPADYDRDGSVTVDDAIYLLQHVLMPEMFPI